MFVYFYLHLIIFSCVLLTHTLAAKIQYLEHFPIPKLTNIERKHIFIDDYTVATYNESQSKLNIVNGYEAPRNVCYVVFSVMTDGMSHWSCGASLITPSVFLTAAHCLDRAIKAVSVVGAHNLMDPRERPLIVFAYKSSFKIHEKYDANLFYNDIGLIKLKESVTLSDKICTIPAVLSCDTSTHSPLTADSDNKNNYTACGWGKTSDTTTTNNLMCMNVQQENQQTCAASYKEKANYNLIESQMCTSGEGGKSTCNGDSGGPLVQPTENGTVKQCGIVSLGTNSCVTGAPSVYTDLSYFGKWICQNIK